MVSVDRLSRARLFDELTGPSIISEVVFAFAVSVLILSVPEGNRSPMPDRLNPMTNVATVLKVNVVLYAFRIPCLVVFNHNIEDNQ